jgi:hypothetical protein
MIVVRVEAGRQWIDFRSATGIWQVSQGVCIVDVDVVARRDTG